MAIDSIADIVQEWLKKVYQELIILKILLSFYWLRDIKLDDIA